MEINIYIVFIVLFMLADFLIASDNHLKPFPVIIDVDGGSDDFLAIFYALKSKELDVRGITYNASAQNIVDIVDDNYPGKNLPVILGADSNLYKTDKNPDTPGCTYQKAFPEGAGKRDQDLLYGLNRQLRLSKRIWYDAIKGFNITKDLAYLIDSTIEETGKKPTIIMTDVPGNVLSVPSDTRAEFNVYFDCVAAQELLASNLDITLVSLDFMAQNPLNPAFFDKLSKLKSFYGITNAVVKNVGVAKIVSNRTLAVTCNGDPNYDGQFVKSNTLTNSNFKVAIDAIVSTPVENSPYFQDFLNTINYD
ncbi:18379_t:CDS:2 [Dentiscutata erythropus]|uniref:18379_t:CDS:1 n=1 Tax=Dentiscutata erythropus TaxID=1348616 RepID=A0A9N9I1Y3_9GLOM|nr:18379_t:CDS:2 [Dentiscutata erythropus]